MQIYDGRKYFYQWDLNQKITSDSFRVGDEIHFVNIKQMTALVVAAYELDGKIVANVPNILLQESYPIIVYRCIANGDAASTIDKCKFGVEKRPKPDDYGYTETELYTIKTAINIALEEAKNSGDFKGDKGDDGVGIAYMTINNDGDLVVTYTNDTFINLGQITGEDGKQGPQGEPGNDGFSPIVSFTDIGNGYKMSVIDANGQKEIQLLNGVNGKDGVDGKDGVSGRDGKDGLTPFVNASNNWQIGDTDTNIKASGQDGKDGISVSKTEINNKGELIITLSDNTVFNLGVVVGEKGDTGNDGISITKTEINDKGELVITFSDNTVSNLGVVAATTAEFYKKDETDTLLNTKADKNKILDYITYEVGYYDDEECIQYNDNEAVITDCSTDISGTYIVPDTIEGYPVTAICNSAFENCTSLTGIVLPNSITYLSYRSFYNCTSLTSIIIPNGVSILSGDAFVNCTSLESVILPDSLTYIGTTVFSRCTKLKSVEIPNGVTAIDDTAFQGCTALTSVYIPVSVTSIAWSFEECSSLKDIYYGGTKEDWNKANMRLWWIEGEEEYNYDTFKDYVTIHYKYGDVPIPTEKTDAANKEYVDEALKSKTDKPKSVAFADSDTITLADNTTYYANSEISSLTVIYPETNFICSLEFNLASQGDITITLPQSKYIGGAPTFANGETWELNIMNGVVVGGLVE